MNMGSGGKIKVFSPIVGMARFIITPVSAAMKPPEPEQLPMRQNAVAAPVDVNEMQSSAVAGPSITRPHSHYRGAVEESIPVHFKGGFSQNVIATPVTITLPVHLRWRK